MKHRVFISPSDQTKNTYAYGNTNEAEQCGKVGKALKAALERCDFEVMLVQYETMASKCAKSDAFGAELHVPVHSNGFNGVVAGTRMMSSDLVGNGYKAAKAIFDKLAPITPGTSENISAQPKLYEIRVPKAPTAYVEIDFHDVDYVAKWIIEHTNEIAEAIAEGICDYFNVSYVKPTTDKEVDKTDMKYYHTFNDLPDWAKKETQELIDSGALKGKGDGVLDISEDLLRSIIISKRYSDSILSK